jgi:hypothetical protein
MARAECGTLATDQASKLYALTLMLAKLEWLAEITSCDT